MASQDCRHRPSFQDLLYTLDALLDEPEALRNELQAREQRPNHRTELLALEEALDLLGHDAPLVADEIRHREAFYRELIQLEPQARRSTVDAVGEGVHFRSWGVADLLIKGAAIVGPMEEASELADLALFIAQRLDTDLYRPAYLADLQARALAALALVELRSGCQDEARRRLDLARSTARFGLGQKLPEVVKAESEMLAAEGSPDRSEAELSGSPEWEIGERLLARLLRYAQLSRQRS